MTFISHERYCSQPVPEARAAGFLSRFRAALMLPALIVTFLLSPRSFEADPT